MSKLEGLTYRDTRQGSQQIHGLLIRYIATGFLRNNSEMSSIDTLPKRLHDETVMIEKEIQSHNQQVEVLTTRLQGLKRASELLNSEQAAIAELLQAVIANRGADSRQVATMPVARGQKSVPNPKAIAVRQQLGRNTQVRRAKTKTGSSTRSVSPRGDLTRVDMIGAIHIEASAN